MLVLDLYTILLIKITKFTLLPTYKSDEQVCVHLTQPNTWVLPLPVC